MRFGVSFAAFCLSLSSVAYSYVDGGPSSHPAVGIIIHPTGVYCSAFQIHPKYIVTAALCASNGWFVQGGNVNAAIVAAQTLPYGENLCAQVPQLACTSAGVLMREPEDSTRMWPITIDQSAVMKLQNPTGGASLELAQDAIIAAQTGVGYGYGWGSVGSAQGVQRSHSMVSGGTNVDTSSYFFGADTWSYVPSSFNTFEGHDLGGPVVSDGKAQSLAIGSEDTFVQGAAMSRLFYDATYYILKDNLQYVLGNQPAFTSIQLSGGPGAYSGAGLVEVSYDISDALMTQLGQGGSLKIFVNVAFIRSGQVLQQNRYQVDQTTDLSKSPTQYGFGVSLPYSKKTVEKGVLLVWVDLDYHRSHQSDTRTYRVGQSLPVDMLFNLP